MEPLNVLIGPNGSGKSNFLEAIALLKAVPREVLAPISRTGGLREWLWNGPGAPRSMTMEAIVRYPQCGELRHSLTLGEENGRLVVAREQIQPLGNCSDERAALSYFRPLGTRTPNRICARTRQTRRIQMPQAACWRTFSRTASTSEATICQRSRWCRLQIRRTIRRFGI